MKKIAYLLLTLGLLAGGTSCVKTEPDVSGVAPTRGEGFPVTVRFSEAEARTVPTRAADENGIGDVNLWAFGSGSGRSAHLFIPGGGSTATLSLTPGSYRIYAVANRGEDLGGRSEAELQSLSAAFTGEIAAGARLPMAARSEVQVTGPASFTLLMERLVSKLSLTLSVAPALQGSLTLESVQLLSVPRSCLYFADNRATEAASLTDYPAERITGTSFGREYYLPENLSGTNPSVGSQRQKDRTHAPAGASYLRIEARHGDRPVTYSVYLGANNTSDFNVGRNTLQHMAVTLSGSEPADLRVARFSLSLGALEASYIPTDPITAPLIFTAENQAGNSFTLSCALTQGQGRVLLGETDITSSPVALPAAGSTQTLSFEPSAYGQQVAFTLTVADAQGRQVSRSLSTYLKPRGELLLSMPSIGSPVSGIRSSFPLSVSEENYGNDFRLELSTPTPASTALFYFQGQRITSGAPGTFTVGAGTHTVEVEGGSGWGGEAALTATVTDTWDESRSLTRSATVSPRVIALHPRLTVEMVREHPIDSTYTMMPHVTLEVTADQAVPTSLKVSVEVVCTGKYTLNGKLKTYTIPQSVTIPAGSTVSNREYIRWPLTPPYYHTSDDSYVSPGYEYESCISRPVSVAPSSYGSFAFQLNAD